MKTIIIAAALLLVSAGASAEWVEVNKTSKATGYLWYPVQQDFPWAYPVTAGQYHRPLTVLGWKYRARSASAKSTIDCRDGRIKPRSMTVYAGESLNGPRVRLKFILLANGLRVVPGRWYAYAQMPAPTRMVIDLACE